MLTRFACLAIGVLLIAVPVSAHAENPVAKAQAIISLQIEAFLADDEILAFKYAAPALRGGITDRAAFLRMVRDRFRPVYRPAFYAFGRSKLAHGPHLILQEVLITDRLGNEWTVLYEMRLMGDGTYRVGNLRLSRNVASQAI